MDEDRAAKVDSFQLGDRVWIKTYDRVSGRITELRGPLGPGGAAVYRVRIGRKPSVSFIELLGDQIELAPKKEPVPQAVAPEETPDDAPKGG